PLLMRRQKPWSQAQKNAEGENGEVMKNQKHDDVKAVEVEQPKTTTPEAKADEPKAPKNTPVNERLYKLVAQPSIAPKGKQRQIVLKALVDAKEPLTVDQVTKIAEKAGLQAVGGVGPSCRYHLHHLVALGFAEIVNPKIVVEEKAA